MLFQVKNNRGVHFSSPQSILVRAPNWIGDQVLAFPFFYQLRKSFPTAKITSISVPWVSDLQYKTLVDEVFVLERPPSGSLIHKFFHLSDEGKKIKARGSFDIGISLPNSFSAAWILYRAGAKFRFGYRNEGRGLLLNAGQDLPDETFQIQHRAQSYVDLLPEGARLARPIKEFFGTFPESELDEKIEGELSRFDYKAYWSTSQLERPKGYYWILAPGATADSRRWPVEYFIQLARLIADATNLSGIVVGGPKEAPIAERLCQIEELRLADYTARGPVSSLGDLFSGAEFTVTNESGLAHVAALCGSFVQIVCGAADPRRTKPIGPGLVQVSLNAVECWPCERNECTQPVEKDIQCLRGIKPEMVWEEIKRGIKKR